jgi:hypothetical protein
MRAARSSGDDSSDGGGGDDNRPSSSSLSREATVLCLVVGIALGLLAGQVLMRAAHAAFAAV